MGIEMSVFVGVAFFFVVLRVTCVSVRDSFFVCESHCIAAAAVVCSFRVHFLFFSFFSFSLSFVWVCFVSLCVRAGGAGRGNPQPGPHTSSFLRIVPFRGYTGAVRGGDVEVCGMAPMPSCAANVVEIVVFPFKN